MIKWCVLAIAALILWGRPSLADVTIFAAASTTAPVQEIIDLYNSEGFGKAKASFASSSVLAKQIAHGAQADIFISANPQWMDYLAKEKAIAPKSRIDLLSNRLVLIAPVDSALTVQTTPAFTLAQKLGGGKLAIGDPDHVPAGMYAKAALQSLGAWNALSGQVVRTLDVRAALALVERGEAAAGIVYDTDAAIAKGVRVIAIFPSRSYPQITYPAAMVVDKGRPETKSFFSFLKSKICAGIFEKYGFVVINWFQR